MLLQRQVDEGVAGGHEAQQAAGDDQRAVARHAQQPEGRLMRGAPLGASASATGPRWSTNSTSTPRPSRAMKKLTRKTEWNASGEAASSANATSGPEHGAGRVHRAVHAERGAELVARRRERDHRVARRGADALARAVEQDDGADRRHAGADRRQRQLAERRQAVARRGGLLVAAEAVADVAAGQPHQRGGAVVDAVDEAEGQRREAADRDEVQRQHRDDHLGGDVGQQAREAQQDDGAADAGRRRRPRRGRRVSSRRWPATSALEFETWYTAYAPAGIRGTAALAKRLATAQGALTTSTRPTRRPARRARAGRRCRTRCRAGRRRPSAGCAAACAACSGRPSAPRP